MSEIETGGALATWSVPDCPFVIDYSPAVLDDIRLAVVDAFFSLPRGGAEIGGLLLGEHRDGHTVITGYKALDCEHAYGPSFQLSPNDHAQLAQLIKETKAAGESVAGWYHSHTRSEIFLSDADIEIHRRYFNEIWQVALVIKPSTFQPARCGFFFRQLDGTIHSTESYLEFSLEAAAVKPAPRPDEVAAAATVPAATVETPPAQPVVVDAPGRSNIRIRTVDLMMSAAPAAPVVEPAPPPKMDEPRTYEVQVESRYETEPAPAPTPQPPAPAVKPIPIRDEPKPIEPPRFGAAAPAPRAPEPKPAPQPEETVAEEPSSKRKLLAKVAWFLAAALTMAGVYVTRDRWMGAPAAAPTAATAPKPGTPAETKPGAAVPAPTAPAQPAAVVPASLSAVDENGQLQIHWDRNSSSVQTAAKGVLDIKDGDATQSIPLDADHLRTGGFTYARHTGAVDVHLTVESGSGQRLVEAYGFHGPAPAAAAAAVPPPAAEPAKPAADPAEMEKLKAENAKLEAEKKRLEKANASLKKQMKDAARSRRMSNQSR